MKTATRAGAGLLAPPAGTEKVRVRAMRESDRAPVLELLRATMGAESNAGDARYWEWKHELNPFGRSPCLVATVDSSVVGLRAFMRWGWEDADGRFSAVRAVDTTTHPEWRRKGIFSRLTLQLIEECAADGVDFVFNTPNDRSRPGYLKMGWREVGRVPAMVRLGRPMRVLASLRRRSATGSQFLEVGSAESVDHLLQHEFVTRALRPRQAREARQLATVRSREFLRWRYVQVPTFTYYAAWDAEGAGAGIIFSLKERNGLRELSVSELLLASRDAIVGGARLLRRTARALEADYAVAVAGRGSLERAALRRAGFLPAKRFGPILCARPVGERDLPVGFFDVDGWRPSLGDVEVF